MSPLSSFVFICFFCTVYNLLSFSHLQEKQMLFVCYHLQPHNPLAISRIDDKTDVTDKELNRKQ
jgi:hypothetical protein